VCTSAFEDRTLTLSKRCTVVAERVLSVLNCRRVCGGEAASVFSNWDGEPQNFRLRAKGLLAFDMTTSQRCSRPVRSGRV
jgi:hypothetical protein